jgi:hypothetical protein
MKPFIVFALWALAGWDAGAWGEAVAGVPSAVGILVGVAIGAALALEIRRRIGAAASGRLAATSNSSLESAPVLDRAA